MLEDLSVNKVKHTSAAKHLGILQEDGDFILKRKASELYVTGTQGLHICRQIRISLNKH